MAERLVATANRMDNNEPVAGYYYVLGNEAWIMGKKRYPRSYRVIPETLNVGEVSDGYHTFNELYRHGAFLFGVICHSFPERAWKAKLHSDGTMFDGMFIVGFDTDLGQATYHYDIDPYWEKFYVRELKRAPEYDGHTPEQALQRLYYFGIDHGLI